MQRRGTPDTRWIKVEKVMHAILAYPRLVLVFNVDLCTLTRVLYSKSKAIGVFVLGSTRRYRGKKSLLYTKYNLPSGRTPRRMQEFQLVEAQLKTSKIAIIVILSSFGPTFKRIVDMTFTNSLSRKAYLSALSPPRSNAPARASAKCAGM